ncbi:PCP reductase family protein [Nitrospiraceae bacterium AH_259_D15_M11_P09]|nr:PCP reductase family protein [Nitrospiraceae bacterium AH_259_D15_M11_P09]
MLICGCGRWMHTEGLEERAAGPGAETLFLRSKCRGCGLRVGVETPFDDAEALVDRVMWTDDARHRLDRMPPYLAPLVKSEVEDYARSKGRRVVTFALMNQARQGGQVDWEPEAERRLENVPAPVRAMARIELERTAAERGVSRVTVSLMEEVKARYFGMASVKRDA